MKKHLLIVGIIFLFILSSVTPLVFGSNIDSKEQSTYDSDLLQDYYDCYSLEEIPESIRPVISEEEESLDIPEIENVVNLLDSPEPFDGPMDSAWPMYCHDVRHTGRSPYSTVETQDEIWRFKQDANDYVRGSPVIGSDGAIYFGGSGDFYALYPNGTLKWKYGPLKGYVWAAPAIDENGTIYFGLALAWPYDFYALNPDGTLKWKHQTASVFSSPAIGDDGTIYFGDSDNWYIKALYPNNGTVKWKYKTGLVVYSSPAIGDDGIIYCGSHDTYLYALYPNNGTLKWRYKTGNWIRTSPCIGDDGTIYVVSLDNYLHAVSPNGTRKWRVDVGAGTSPTIGHDGTIYAGYEILYAVNPNGTVKWQYDNSGKITGSTPAHSLEDTIYFGAGTCLFAVNPDGTLIWQEKIAIDFADSAPAIGEDGTVYVGSASTGGGSNYGHLHAFGKFDSNAPSTPKITGQTSGKPGREYEYTFKSSSPLGRDVYYYIEWGDGSINNWFGPYKSYEEVKVSHTFSNQGNYTIKARAKDIDNLWGPWGELEISMPRSKAVHTSLLLLFLENHPNIFPILQLLIQRFGLQ